MFNRFTLLVAVSATALATVTAPPALSAESDDIGKWLVGVGLVAAVAAIIKHREDRDDDDNDANDERARRHPPVQRQVPPRDIHVERNVIRNVYPQRQFGDMEADSRRQTQNTVILQRPAQRQPGANRWPGHIELRYRLPTSCRKKLSTRNGKLAVYRAACLKRAGIRAGDLPGECRRVVDVPARQRGRTVWGVACLAEYGYRID